MIEERKNVAYLGEGTFHKIKCTVPAKESSSVSKFLGMDIVSTPLMPDGIARVVHADGRVQVIEIAPSDYYA